MADVLARAEVLGVLAEDLARWRQAPGPPGVVFGFGAIGRTDISAGLQLLGRAFADADRTR